MELNYKRFGSGEPLIVLHGLMGMLDNWQGPSKRLSEHFTVYIVDQRNHGRSPHSDEFSYAAMAEDLEELIDDLGYDSVNLLGHSMGGKTVMKFAENNPEFVQKLVVADIGPRAYPVHHQTILEALHAVELNTVGKRSEAEEVLKRYIADNGIRQFLLKNLYWIEKGKLAWRFNLNAITNNIEDIGEAVFDRVYQGPTLFVRGSKSDYIRDEDWPEIELAFPDAQLATIKGAGHWLHAEKPDPFLDVVLDFLLD